MQRSAGMRSRVQFGETLAVVKDTLFTDHCVVVLDVTENEVVLADPVTGRRFISHEDFKSIWRFSGITLRRGAI